MASAQEATSTFADLEKRFAEIEADVEADVDGDDADLGSALCDIIREALRLETPDTVDRLVDLLARIARTTENPAALGLVLNNLGCVEKRRRNFKVALHHLKRAADEEGGIPVAHPTTLLNISATYASMQMYAEAASVAQHAATRCETSAQRPAPGVYAAALYNLGAALEGSGEVDHAFKAYERAKKVLDDAGAPKESPQYLGTVKSIEQLELRMRNYRGNRERSDWSEQVLPSLIKKVADKSLNGGKPADSQNLKEMGHSSRRLQPLAGRKGGGKPSQRANTTGASPPAARATPAADASSPTPRAPEVNIDYCSDSGDSRVRSAPYAGAPNQTQSLTAPSPHRGGHEMSQRSDAIHSSMSGSCAHNYTATVRSFHVFPVNSREASKSYQAVENPEWDRNPFLSSPIRKQLKGRDPTVDRSVQNSYMPYHLVPFLAGLTYKEHTHRTSIITDHRDKIYLLHVQEERARSQTEEDQQRVDVEINELRARKVLLQWSRGKIVFVTRLGELEAGEREERVATQRAFLDRFAASLPQAQLLQLQAAEEEARVRNVDEQQQADLRELMLVEQTSITDIEARRESQVPRRGLAHGLALWCLEGALPAKEAEQLADPHYLSSHLVMMRHNWFGKPFGYARVPTNAPLKAAASRARY